MNVFLTLSLYSLKTYPELVTLDNGLSSVVIGNYIRTLGFEHHSNVTGIAGYALHPMSTSISIRVNLL